MLPALLSRRNINSEDSNFFKVRAAPGLITVTGQLLCARKNNHLLNYNISVIGADDFEERACVCARVEGEKCYLNRKDTPHT